MKPWKSPLVGTTLGSCCKNRQRDRWTLHREQSKIGLLESKPEHRFGLRLPPSPGVKTFSAIIGTLDQQVLRIYFNKRFSPRLRCEQKAPKQDSAQAYHINLMFEPTVQAQ